MTARPVRPRRTRLAAHVAYPRAVRPTSRARGGPVEDHLLRAPVGRRDYDERHVRWLKRQCDHHAPGVPFVCLTDLPHIDGVTTEPLLHDWPGWWSKVELFRFDDVLYLDLDPVLLADIRPMLELEGFHAVRNFGRNGLRGRILPSRVPMNSSIMTWGTAPRHVYDDFDLSITDRYRTKRRWGDQGYVHDRMRGRYRALQDVFPGRIQSYKFGDLDRERPDADIVCFHGRPRPWEAGHSWVPPLAVDR